MSRQPQHGGPSRMYEVQRAAYQDAAAYSPSQTDSTPDNPPSFTPADLTKASATKRKITIESPPSKCSHCGASFEGVRGCLTETRDGTVMAYCKGQGGCGRSQVLFIQPDLTIPHYKQVCVFEPLSTHPSLNSPIHSIHGLMPNDVPCTKCRQNHDVHPKGYDQNGWVVDSRDTLTLPDDWPKFDGTAWH